MLCRLTIEARQSYNLGHSHRWQRHESHERVFAILQAVQKLETRIVDSRGEGGRVLGHCRRHVGVDFGDLYLLEEFGGSAMMIQDVTD